jgi:hypothetical protein
VAREGVRKPAFMYDLGAPPAPPAAQGNRVCVWVVALKFFDMGFRYQTRRGTPFVPNMFSHFTHGFPNAIALHPGIATWVSLVEDWSTRNDLSPQDRIRVLTAATDLGSEWAGAKLEQQLSQIENMDAAEWLDGDEAGHTLSHALHHLLKRKPLVNSAMLDVTLSSKRYNIKRYGLMALANQGDLNALHRLIELHATENDWHLADTIENSIELLAARLAVFVREADGKFEIIV